MEDIMLIRSSFMRRIISQIINKALKKQAPGVEVELKEAQVNWVDKEQKMRVHLELDAEVTKAQLNDILKKAGVLQKGGLTMKLTKTCAKFLRKHGGTLLAIGASLGVGLTMWETGKATVKATTLITMNKDESMTKKEIVRDCWKFYIPAVVVGAGTVACILGSNALNKKQLASMTAAYMALGKAYQEYRQKVIENIGIEKEAEIQEQIKEEKLPEVREKMEEEKLLCYEPISKRYFHATEAVLLEAFYSLNRDFALNGHASMNDLYNYLGLDYIPEGDLKGWCADYLANDWEYFWIDFSYLKQKTDDGLEVYYVEAYQEPINDYLNYDPSKDTPF